MTEPTRLSPDARRAMRTSVVSIGVAVAVTAAVLVAGVLGVTALYLWLQSNPSEQNEPPPPGELRLSIDASHVLLGLTVVGIAAVLIAGVATVFIARRAVRPLEDAFARQRRFVADASHELRTPLTVLHARIQLLQRRIEPDSGAAPIALELAADAQTLISILNDLIEASDDAQPPPETGSADARDVIDTAVATIGSAAAERDVTVTVRHADLVTVRMPAAQLNRCLLAVLDSALQHTPNGSTIMVSTEPAGRFLCIDVHDESPTMTREAAEQLFDRFAHRPDPNPWGGVPTAARGGRAAYGLGLFLVRETMSRYGGTAAITPTLAGGNALRLMIPRDPPA